MSRSAQCFYLHLLLVSPTAAFCPVYVYAAMFVSLKLRNICLVTFPRLLVSNWLSCLFCPRQLDLESSLLNRSDLFQRPQQAADRTNRSQF